MILLLITAESPDILKPVSPSGVIATRRKVCVEQNNKYIYVQLHLKLGKICEKRQIMRKDAIIDKICGILKILRNRMYRI